MATELAKAYVQIVPSAKGIKGSITNALGGEADAAGAAAGQGFGGKMMGMIKGAIATAAIGKAIAATVSEGAALQQSLGGIETLFKGNADTVTAYAAQAYRTAGLSANNYMETVTGFSASLLQGLGGDTQKAAEISNMAIIDMADNSNKMGTSMESIQYAYQGFAKQNYTMLDNLKLGYGGTKTEMQRLLADAQKLTGVKYDMNNLSDVYSSIHAIQGEMGITGTTAQEAASTITGSAAAMKSAFQNVLGQLTLGQDVGPALQGLAETVTTFLVGNLLPAIWNIIRALPGAIVTFVQAAGPQLMAALAAFIPQVVEGIRTGGPMLLATASDLLNQFLNAITVALPMLLQRGQEVIMWLINGISLALPQFATAAFTMLTIFVQNIITSLPQILEAGKNILTSLVSGILQTLPQISLAAWNAIIAMVSALISHLPEIIAAGFDLIVSLINGIGNAMPNVIATAGEIVKNIWNAITKIDWLELGKNIVQGIINGIGAMAGALWDAAAKLASSALEAIQGFLGIHSPSTVMRDAVGRFIPAGIAVGIEGNTKPVSAAMQGMARLTTGSFQSDLSMTLSRNQLPQGTKFAAESDSRTGGRSGEDMASLLQNLKRTIEIHISAELDSREVYKGMKRVEESFGYDIGGMQYAW